MADILVVDDQPSNRKVLSNLLSYTGHRVFEAGDGADALSLMRISHPDLVIADLLMPEMDGYELVREIRNDPDIADTRVVFHSAAYHELEARPLAEACGVNGFLPKPAPPQTVLKLVNSLLNTAQEKQPPVSAEDYSSEHRRLLGDKLVRNSAQLEAANLRLVSLNDLGHQLARESDPRRILQLACDAARELVAAKYAAISVIESNDDAPRHFFVCGLPSNRNPAIEKCHEYRGLLMKIAMDGQTVSVHDLSGDLRSIGLPPKFPTVDTVLGVPLVSTTGVRGALCLFDPIVKRTFADEDVTTVNTVAAEVSIAYANARHREKLEQEIARRTQATEDLKAMSIRNEVLEEFATVAAHDLTSPLATVHLNLEYAAERCKGKIDDTTEAAIARGLSGVMRMDKLIQSLLAYARAAEGLESATVDCSDIVSDCLKNLAADIQATNAQIACEPLPIVRGDRVRLTQVFQNLIGNAIKFRDRRGNAIPRITIRAEQLPSEHLFSVVDTGIGIPPDKLKDVFGCFTRLHGQNEFPGSGIGLATCKKIVESHHGRIWVESQLGKGSTFRFTLPLNAPRTTDGAAV